MKFTIDARAMSLNQAYPTNAQGRRFLCNEGKAYKQLIQTITRREILKQDFLPDSKFYKLSLTFGFTDFWTKDKRVSKKRPDISNSVKIIEDAIFETIGVDDNLVVNASQEVIRENHKSDFIIAEVIKIK